MNYPAGTSQILTGNLTADRGEQFSKKLFSYRFDSHRLCELAGKVEPVRAFIGSARSVTSEDSGADQSSRNGLRSRSLRQLIARVSCGANR
jgi:hypothetical protein